MTQYAVKTGRSNGFEAQRQDIVPGSWYAPTRQQTKADYRGVEFLGYRVTRSLPINNGHTRWEIVCLTCGLKKQPEAHVVRDCIADGGGRRLRECSHPDIPLNSGGVRDLFGIRPSTLRAMIAVLAYEKLYQRGPLRLHLLELMKGTVDTLPLVKKGWLLSEGTPQRLSSTEKGRRALGVKP